jgi:hypothetical protein
VSACDRCEFGSRCISVDRRGGTDEHHRWPKSWGGPANGPLIRLCPSHHRRQHSLLHAWADATAAGQAQPSPQVLRLFSAPEIALAREAHDKWAAAGRPPIKGEPAKAAGQETR